MVTRWHTSDTHFSHKNIITYSGRPFNDVDEMNEGLIERWNSVVAPNDIVYHHGDVALSSRGLSNVQFLNGEIILLAGNHDACWHGHKKGASKAISYYLEAGFSQVIQSGIIYNHEMSNGLRVTLSHLPYASNTHDDRKFESFRPIDNGQFNLCGHVHEKWTVKGKSINVGVDAPGRNWFPVSEEALIEEINDLKI